MKLSYKYHTCDVPVGLLRCLKRRMRWVRAAGCIVSDDAGNLLLIRRNGRYDLPKGKVEPGETLRQAAIRETLEETGIAVKNGERRTENGELCCRTQKFSVLSSQFSVPIKTYHIYNLYGGWHLKQTSWFAARAAGVRPQGTPQGEEGITDILWVGPDQWHQLLNSSYGTLRTLSRSQEVKKLMSQEVKKSRS